MVRTGRHSVKLKWHRKGGGKDKISTLPKVKKKKKHSKESEV